MNAPRAFAVLLSIAASAGVACEHPPLVLIPAVSEVSWNKQELLPTEMQHYLTDMQSYLECLRAEIDALDDEQGLAASLLAARNNAVTWEEVKANHPMNPSM